MRMPEQGFEMVEVFERMQEIRAADADWREGKTFGYVYDAGPDVEEVAKRAYMMFLSENALDPTVYPSLLKFEVDIVSMARDHLHGDAQVTGNFTSGGTESCMLAVKTARDHARAHRPDIGQPEMVMPVTAHAAFYKAAHYFGVKPVVVPVDRDTFRANPRAMQDAITPNTVLLVASAVSYAHGVMDPIADIGRIALKSGVLFHVDGCIGAFLLPYFRRFGADIPHFDFRVPGVTSISMDLHKYAYCPKGASLLLYRNKEIRFHQIFTCSEWTGYTVINHTFQSSKSGGPVAAAWAVMNYLGDEGYTRLARQVYDATLEVRRGIEAIDDLHVLGTPEMSLLAVASDSVNVFHVIDEMKSRGWYLQPQLRTGDCPENFHLSINPSNAPVIGALLEDLGACTAAARKLDAGGVDHELLKVLSGLSVEMLTPETVTSMLETVGVKGGRVPERMAAINGILNALPPPVANRLLTVFMNEMFHPAE